MCALLWPGPWVSVGLLLSSTAPSLFCVCSPFSYSVPPSLPPLSFFLSLTHSGIGHDTHGSGGGVVGGHRTKSLLPWFHRHYYRHLRSPPWFPTTQITQCGSDPFCRLCLFANRCGRTAKLVTRLRATVVC